MSIVLNDYHKYACSDNLAKLPNTNVFIMKCFADEVASYRPS